MKKIIKGDLIKLALEGQLESLEGQLEGLNVTIEEYEQELHGDDKSDSESGDGKNEAFYDRGKEFKEPGEMYSINDSGTFWTKPTPGIRQPTPFTLFGSGSWRLFDPEEE